MSRSIACKGHRSWAFKESPLSYDSEYKRKVAQHVLDNHEFEITGRERRACEITLAEDIYDWSESERREARGIMKNLILTYGWEIKQ
jgi:hypothetical protein